MGLLAVVLALCLVLPMVRVAAEVQAAEETRELMVEKAPESPSSDRTVSGPAEGLAPKETPGPAEGPGPKETPGLAEAPAVAGAVTPTPVETPMPTVVLSPTVTPSVTAEADMREGKTRYAVVSAGTKVYENPDDSRQSCMGPYKRRPSFMR